ncbi:MAG: NAD(P)H-dependent oxidoreductase subunit E [Bacteriovoracaceae bacterium]|nr:NAD(P)H-dependent oxidoreductase subunit E [Bacteriovoracaceae bacterium]
MHSQMQLSKIKNAHKSVFEFDFTSTRIENGRTDRILRIDLSEKKMSILPVSQEMKDLWVGGKGFDMWMTLQEVNKDTKWDDPQNPICFGTGPLAGTTSFPGAGKTIVTAISPATNSIVDSNVGGYFGPYLKFAGFDCMVIVGKASEDSIIYIDAVKGKIKVETAPLEKLDSHVIAEELTDMYADNELDKRNIAVVSAGSASEHSRMGLLNFSFFDWRRNIARLKQAGRGGIGTVFRNKKLKALVIKNKGVTPTWTISKNKSTKNISIKNCLQAIEKIDKIIDMWNADPDFLLEIMQHLQHEYRHISKTAIERLGLKLKTPKSYIYHVATFYKIFTLEPLGENTIEVCMGPGCHGKGASILLENFERELGIKNGETTKCGKFTLKAASCLGVCDIAPVIRVNGKLLGKVKNNDVKNIIENPVVEETDNDVHATVHTLEGEQTVAMCGGDKNYTTFKKLLRENNPEQIIDQITASGLTGRGGAGFPTGDKWNHVKDNAAEKNEKPVIVCNSAIFEPDPHTVIEGMLIGALATGADTGYICYRNEHLPALVRQHEAIIHARKKGILGKNILGSDFSFNIKVRHGAGGFLIGESSALIQTLEGRVGEPKPKYIKLSENGFHGRPTLTNNIETWANIPLIMEKGAPWYRNIGSTSSGTKLLSLSGDINKPCNVEVPLGTTIRKVIETFGGGVPKKRKIKAVQFGGPTGGFIPECELDLKIDYEPLKEVGAIMGSGMIVVKNERKCMVDSVKYQIDFLLDESCGKCTPCREGLFALKNLYQKISDGRGKEEDLDQIEEIAILMKETSLCQLGKTAPNFILTSLNHFRDEYLEHIRDKRCSVGACKEISTFEINDNCNGCTLCAKSCPASCISGERKQHHLIDQSKCIKCGICFEVCNFHAVEVK